MLAEDECAIDVLIVARTLKMYPAKRQGEGDGGSEKTSPGNKPVGRPACVRAFFNETLDKEIREEYLCQPNNVARQPGRTKENSPALKPILPRGRTTQPHSEAISDAKSREHASAGIGYESGVVVFERVAADKNCHQQGSSNTQAPKRCVSCVSSACFTSNQNEGSRSPKDSFSKY